MKSRGITTERIEFLKKREAEIRAKIAQERVREQKREWKEFDRLKGIVGGVLLAIAADDPVFAGQFKDRLRKAALPESERNFLRAKGWV